VLCSSNGVPVSYELTPANVADVSLTEELLNEAALGEGIARRLLGDLAYRSEGLREALAEMDILLVTEPSERRRGVRQRVEIALSSLKRVFGLGETLATTLVGLATRIATKIAAYTYAFVTNRRLGRPQGRIKELWANPERRVVYKAEVMEEGTNTRFVVTNKPDEPDELYNHYTERGETENRIKDLKVALKADRLSCHRFWANQFRLLLHAAAYWLMDTLRRKLVVAGIERMQLDTLRLKLVKIGGRVRELLTKVRIHLASGHPGQYLWHALSRAFGVVHE
jgi:hypothetical protein